MEKEDFREISYEEELQRAKWFKEDLEKGGWSEGLHTPGVSTFWFKTFPDMEVPIKALFTMEIPVPAEKVVEILAPANVKYQREWNAAFPVNELIENYIEQEGGGSLLYTVLKLSWPLTNRAYLVFIPPSKEVDWYGKKAFLLLQKNAWHHSKPPGADGFVRATNGGNFSLVIPDEENPSGACKMFMLRNNNYNGCLPNKGIQFLIAKTLPPKFNLWREGIIDAYKRFFREKI